MWAQWSQWTKVDAVNSCRKKIRTRSCSHPYPSCGGSNCYGKSKESRV